MKSWRSRPDGGRFCCVLPEVALDDWSFQELVNEARTRIVRSCPEWTEHNVSDPGITLIELFAWMTEMLLYRINRIPEKLHLALLELVGVVPGPAVCASTDIRFMLDGEAEQNVEIPAGTEIATHRTSGEDAVIFQVTRDFEISSLRLSAYAVQRAGLVESVTVSGGVARPTGSQQAAFSTPPTEEDALLLGFPQPIGQLVVRVELECTRARGHVEREDPPLCWEVSDGHGGWRAATIVADDTGGFLLGGGAITLSLPPEGGAHVIGGEKLHWLRCRTRERAGASRAAYTHPPEISEVAAGAIGATVPAIHAAVEHEESLGTGDGTPGTTWPLRHRPVLPPEDGEVLEVHDPGGGEWTTWKPVSAFADSRPADRHFMLDCARGEVLFGPAIRQPEGGWRQFGAVPVRGAALRFSRYRHGGGRAGNVAAHALTVPRTPLPWVSSVTNPHAATGGVDAESIESARGRAALEIRTRSRAVTAEDFERLTIQASPRVSRAVCLAPADGRPICVHVLPHVEAADRQLTLDELTPEDGLMAELAAHLDERRLIGTSVRLLPVRFKAISVVVEVEASPLADLERVERDVAHALYVYLNPLIGGSPSGPAQGWPFGRGLNQGELFGIVYEITGVEFVKILRTYETDLRTGEQAAQPAESHLALDPGELIASATHIVKATHRGA